MKSNSQTGFDLVVERVHNRFPHVLLGITTLLVITIMGSLIIRSRASQNVNNLTETPIQNTSPSAAPNSTPTPTNTNGIGSKIAEFFLPKTAKVTPTPVLQRTHVVKTGEALWTISEEAYGDGKRWNIIAEANGLSAPYVLEIGTKLMLPTDTNNSVSGGDTTIQAATTNTRVTTPGTSYVVQAGDSLWTIAENAYGDGLMYHKIVQTNKITSPDLIYPNQRFALPRN